MDKERGAIAILGATGGFGAEFARLAAEDGKDIFLIGRNEEKLNELAERLKKEHPGIIIEIAVVDFLKLDSLSTMVDAICSSEHFDFDREATIVTQGRKKRIDSIIYAAGVGGLEHALTPEKREKIETINVNRPIDLVDTFSDIFSLHGGGKIMITTGTAAFDNTSLQTTYAESRKKMWYFLRDKAKSLRGSNVTVTNFMPVMTRTSYQKSIGADILRSGLESPAVAAEIAYKAMEAGSDRVVATKNMLIRLAYEGMEPPKDASKAKTSKAIRKELKRSAKIMKRMTKPCLLRKFVKSPEEEERLVEALNKGKTIEVLKTIVEIQNERREREVKKERERAEMVIQKDKDAEINDTILYDDLKRAIEVTEKTHDSKEDKDRIFMEAKRRRVFDSQGLNMYGQNRVEVRLVENIMMAVRKKYQKDVDVDLISEMVHRAFSKEDVFSIFTNLNINQVPCDISDIFDAQIVELLRQKGVESLLDFRVSEFSRNLPSSTRRDTSRDVFSLFNALEDGRTHETQKDREELNEMINMAKEIPADEVRSDRKRISDEEINAMVKTRNPGRIYKTMSRVLDFFKGKNKESREEEEFDER